MTDRKHERVPARLEVEFRNASAFLVAYSTNLSRGGMFVETNDPLPVGHQLTLRFAVPTLPTIEVTGVIAWVQAWGTNEHEKGMGIRFEHIDERHGDLIDRLVGAFRGVRVVVMSGDDSMSGQLFEATVTVTLNGVRYRGCGERVAKPSREADGRHHSGSRIIVGACGDRLPERSPFSDLVAEPRVAFLRIRVRSFGSTGFTRCASNPASRTRARSLAWPHPVIATR